MFSTFRSEATLAFWYRLSAGQHQSTSNLRAGINIVSFPSNAAEVSRRSTNFQTCHLRHLRSCAFWTHFLGERRRAPEDDEPRRWILSRRAPPRFLSNFSDRGCRRPPRSRRLDSRAKSLEMEVLARIGSPGIRKALSKSALQNAPASPKLSIVMLEFRKIS